MDQALTIMFPPLVACLILTGIHTYLGLHVVSREVIFVDLALAQIAALGSTFAFLLGFDPRSSTGYFYSLSFAFLGAAIFSLSRLKDNRVPQEALIGITFAVASSAAILIADRAPQGAEHVEEMLTGSILWITWPTIWKTLFIYVVVGLFHFIFRRKFLLISMAPEEAERQGVAVRWWDFLFYVSFGFVITSSVAIAGVLLVFSFLIIPSVIGMLFSKSIGTRLAIGWVSGTLVSLLGLYFSYKWDFPSGPSIVCSFGAFLILAALLHHLAATERKGIAMARIGAGTIVLVLLVVAAVHFRPVWPEQEGPLESRLDQAARILQELAMQETADPEALGFLRANQELLENGLSEGRFQPDQETVRRLGALGEPGLIPLLRALVNATEDPWTEYYASKSLLELGNKEEIHHFIKLLGEPVPVFLKSQAIETLKGIVGDDYGFQPGKSPEENQEPIDRLEVWWHQNSQRLVWDQEKKTFYLP